MLEQENSNHSPPASRGQEKQVPSWLFIERGREEPSPASFLLPEYPEQQFTSSAGDTGIGRTALLSRLDSRENPTHNLINSAFLLTLIENVFPRPLKNLIKQWGKNVDFFTETKSLITCLWILGNNLPWLNYI